MKIKSIALALAILAFFFFVCSPFQQAAKALAGVDDAVIAIIIAALAAMGITLVASDSYNSLQEYVEGLLQQYANHTGMSTYELFNGVQVGTNKLGQVLLNNRLVVIINGFVIWLKAELGLINNNTTTAYDFSRVEFVNGNSLPIYTVNTKTHSNSNGPWWSNDLNYSNTVGLVVTSLDNEWHLNTGYTIRLWYRESNSQWVYQIEDADNEILGPRVAWSGSSQDDVKLVFVRNTYGFYSRPFALLSVLPDSEHLNQSPAYYTAPDFASIFLYGTSVRTGVITPPSEDSTYNDGDGAILDLGETWGTTFDDVIEGIEDKIDAEGEVEATIEYEDQAAIEEEVTDAPSSTVSQQANDYQVTGLESVFPFCIPFDIYNFFDCLAADPVAPSFEWRFYVPGICDETIELDLSQFDTVAQIVRTMELLAFIVGLAFVTRDKMIKG